MDGMCDASGTLQGDIVEKHGSLPVDSLQDPWGAANSSLNLGQYWKQEWTQWHSVSQTGNIIFVLHTKTITMFTIHISYRAHVKNST